jgi:hypothetical protein
MIPKSGNRFSEKDHAQTKSLKRDDDSKKNHPALTHVPDAAQRREVGTRDGAALRPGHRAPK